MPKKTIPREGWECPKCQKKTSLIMVKDGGSAHCEKCGTNFHYCSFYKEYSTYQPLLSCECSKFSALPSHKKGPFKYFKLKKKNPILDKVMEVLLAEIPDKSPGKKESYEDYVCNLILDMETIDDALVEIKALFK